MGFQPEPARASETHPGADPAPLTLPWTTSPAYDIVYFAPQPQGLRGSRVAPAHLEDVLDSRTVSSWKAVVEQHRQAPIQALIFHSSALNYVDATWLAQVYRQGMVIAAFNVTAPILADLLDSPGIARDGFLSQPYPGDFYLVVSRLTLGQPEDVAGVHTALDAGVEEPRVLTDGPLLSAWGRSQDQMIYEDSLKRFALVLVNHIEGIQRTIEDYKNMAAPPIRQERVPSSGGAR